MAAMRPSILQRFAGTPEIYREIEANRVALKEAVDHQNELTKTHRAFEGDILREIKSEVVDVKSLAKETNARVTDHDQILAIISDREQQTAERTAAKLSKLNVIASFAGGSAFCAVLLGVAKALGWA